MSTLQELVGPKSNTKRWIASPAAFNCHTCGAPQTTGSSISRVFHGQGEWERGEWEWNTPDCEKCEIKEMISHYIQEAEVLAGWRSTERDFNEYTRDEWVELCLTEFPTDFSDAVRWVAARHDLLEFQKKLSRLVKVRFDDENYYGRDGLPYEKVERVDWWRNLQVPDLPEKPELDSEGQIYLAAVREIDPNHPIVAWLG